MKKIFLSFLLVICITSCSIRFLPLKPEYFASGKRLGLLILTDKIQYTGDGEGLGAVLTSDVTNKVGLGSKFRTALNKIGPDVNPSDTIKDFYLQFFTSKGMNIIPIDEKIDYSLQTLNDYGPASKNKIFFKKDLRFLKDKYPINEVLLVRVSYGAVRKYYSRGEVFRSAMTGLFPVIVNLNDNSIVYKNENTGYNSIPQGNFETEKGLSSLANSVKVSTDSAIYLENEYISKTKKGKIK